MATETKNWVLVSTKIPSDFEVLYYGDLDGNANPVRSDWEYRAYEVPEWGSFDGVVVNEDDRFIAQVCGPSLDAIDEWPHETGMIGDVRTWGGEYHIVAVNGDFVTIPAHDRYCREYLPQRFGLEPFPVWDPAKDVNDDLTDQVFGE